MVSRSGNNRNKRLERQRRTGGSAAGGAAGAKPDPDDELELPAVHDWRTTDEDEINRRRLRAQSEAFRIRNTDGRFPVYSNFEVLSGSGMTYTVEIRDVSGRQFSCTCQDFRKNGLGTCKHAEAVLLHLEGRYARLFKAAVKDGSTRIDLVIDPGAGRLWIERGVQRLPAAIRSWFGEDGALAGASENEALEAFEKLRRSRLPEARISQDVAPWLETRRRVAERKQLRRDYELRVRNGEWPVQETKVPLFPYQRDGMLHLAFTERALLADEMGLGKTIQAIAACALLKRLGKAERVLVVTPASLKGEWEEQIRMFTDLPSRLVFGPPAAREAALAQRTFFTIVNYEQLIRDGAMVNRVFEPDVVILDEAQRIKNWSTLSAQAVKRLQSRYAFVLTGTPIENRIDELYSIMDFLDPSVLGPLFRFNREFYELDECGRPSGYRNLAALNERITPYMLRRRKSDVETELPARVDRTHFVKLAPKQQDVYDDLVTSLSRLTNILKRRLLTRQEQERLMKFLAMMRMVCDTNYILDPADRECPKLAELERILEECRANPGVKVIIFSEWERMLDLVRGACRRLKLGFAWHTGSVPQQRRRAEIRAFKTDPDCRVFLSTDSGATGLNLQNASVVINCDLPWNPAKLEQRIARAWRKNQTRTVSVINLVAENTIEHRMLETLANKQALADGVLDRKGDLESIPLRTGAQAFLKRLSQLISTTSAPRTGTPPASAPSNAQLPTDRPLGFSQAASEKLGRALIACEERFPGDKPHSVLYMVVDGPVAPHRPQLESLHATYFSPSNQSVHLEVVDRTTHETLQRLIDSGLITPAHRAARPLHPLADASSPLTDSERAAARESRTRGAHHLRMARVLGSAGFASEARSPILLAIAALAQALAVESRLPIPTEADWFTPPFDRVWGQHAVVLRDYSRSTGADWQAAAAALDAL